MNKWGLQNAGLEPWGEYGRGWELEEFSISMKQPYNSSIVGYALPWSSSTPGEIIAPIYQLPSFYLMDSAFLENHRYDFKGKIILLTENFTIHQGDSMAFSTRLSDSQLAKMPNSHMITRQQIEG